MPKKDVTLPFCLDYSRLNAVAIIGDGYPIQHVDECIASLGYASMYSTLDADCGFWQVKVADEDRKKQLLHLIRVYYVLFGSL